TLSGADELQGIGNRMAQEYKSVFAGKGMDVYMTEKVRTQQSANAFLLAFKNYHQANIRRSIIPDSVDYMLRFYDLSPAYQDYKKSEFIKNRLDSLVNDKHTAEAVENVCKKIFRPAFAEKLLAKGVEAAGGKSKKVTATMFAESLYDLYCTQFLSHKEAAAKGYNIDFGSAFDESDLQWFDKLSNAEDFFEKGPATDASGIQAAIAAPLLADLLRTTDAVIQGTKHIDAVLRFTHAEAISPLATLLGIWQASVTSPSVFTFDKYWQAAGIIPMSANIQWILYYNGKDYLVKVLLNEQEAKLPLPAYAFPYYRLSDLQGWYKNVLQQAQQKW
ncbi:MAG TPA: histidine-type phosphatase, partial [Chitinophagaceae bacterium]|nr:histidine-type phosphatase [Chitinophagaceae bacterium]